MPDETHNAPAPSSPSVPAEGEGITPGSYVNGERERVAIEFCQRHGEGEPLPVLTLYDDAPPVGSGQRAPMLLDAGTRQWLAERLGFAARILSDAAKLTHLTERHHANIRERNAAREAVEKAEQRAADAEKRMKELQYRVRVPDSAVRADAWIDNGWLIVCGDPHDSEDFDDADAHSSDAMGCSSVSHVIIRERLTPHGTLASAAKLTALAEERDRLAKVVDRLPKTADGVPIVPGMTVYANDIIARNGMRVTSFDGDEITLKPVRRSMLDSESGPARLYYSTREAAALSSLSKPADSEEPKEADHA